MNIASALRRMDFMNVYNKLISDKSAYMLER